MKVTSETSRRIETFNGYYREMRKVMQSEADWETKYDLVFSLARETDPLDIRVDYHDPDMDYSDDVKACFAAYEEKAKQLAEACGFELEEDDDEET